MKSLPTLLLLSMFWMAGAQGQTVPERPELDSLRKAAQSAQFTAKKPTEAIELWSQLLQQRPEDNQALRSRSAAYADTGQHALAERDAIRATELEPNNSNAWNSLCWGRILANRPLEARPACEKAVALDSGSMPATVNLGHTWLLAGDTKTAQSWYQKTLPLINSDSDLKDGPLADFDLFIAHGWQVDASHQAKAWFETEGTIWLSRLAPVIKLIADVNVARDKRDFARAITLLEELLKLLIDLRGEDHPQVEKIRKALPEYMNSRANQLFSEGRYADALPLYRQVLAAREATGSTEAITKSLLNLGTTWQRMGKYAETESLFVRALELTEKTNGPDHAAVADVLQRFADLLRKNLSTVAMRPYLRRILAICEKNLGVDHPDVVSALNNLASVVARDEAVTLHRRIIAIQERELGPHHPKVAIAAFALAESLKEMKQHDEAAATYLRALSIFERNGDTQVQNILSEHERRSWIGRTHFQLFEMLDSLKRHEEADRYFSRVLSLLEETFSGGLALVERPPSNSLEKFGWALLAAEVRLGSLFGNVIERLPRQSIAIRERIFGANHPLTVGAESALAKALFQKGEIKEAESILRRTITFRTGRADADQMLQSMDANHLGQIRLHQGDLSEAEALFRRALQINEKIENAEGISADLVFLGQVMTAQGRFEDAALMLDRALNIVREATAKKIDAGPAYELFSMMREKRLRPKESMALNALALNWIAAGSFSKVITLLEAHVVARENSLASSSIELVQTYALLGGAYLMAGDDENAAIYARKVLAILDGAAGVTSAGKASLIAQVAPFLPKDEAISHLRDATKAIETTQGEGIESIETMMALGALLPAEEGVPILKRALAALGNQSEFLSAQVSLLLGRQMMFNSQTSFEAEIHLLHAEKIFARAGSANPMLVWSRISLSTHFASNERNDLAIFYGKLAVNGVQQLRSLNAGLSKELQGKFIGRHGEIYKIVSDLLLNEGRIPEAQQILAMLKEDELFQFTQRSTTDDPRKTRAGFDGRERVWADRYETISGQLAALSRERDSLIKKAQVGLSAEEQSRKDVLDADMAVARQAYDAFTAELKREFTQSDASAGRSEKERIAELGSKNLTSLRALQGTLRDLALRGHSTAVTLHYLMTDKRLWILLTTPTIQLKREAAISEADLNRQIAAYRDAIDRRDPRIKELGKALYDLIIAPVADDLQQAGAQTLMLSLDGSLRYLPMAALYDGERFLIQRYRLAIYTTAATAQLNVAPKADWNLAGFGLTRAVTIGEKRFSALDSVKGELEGIAQDMKGTVKLDQDFTAKTLQTGLEAGTSVVHLASHFVFKPGNETDSFLLMGDGNPLSLATIRNYEFSNVDLLTLSACETAVGGGKDANGREVEGFGVQAQEQGAKGVIATLWPVADQSTGQFMQLFVCVQPIHIEAGRVTA